MRAERVVGHPRRQHTGAEPIARERATEPSIHVLVADDCCLSSKAQGEQLLLLLLQTLYPPSTPSHTRQSPGRPGSSGRGTVGSSEVDSRQQRIQREKFHVG